MEPAQLHQGKLFHKRVQSEWKGTIEGKTVRPELSIQLQFNSKTIIHSRRGRIDIFVDQISDFITIVELKSTDWDKIKTQNIRKLLGSHSRQLFKYIDKFLEIDKLSVCAVIIYPKAPSLFGMKDLVENYFYDSVLQRMWYDN